MTAGEITLILYGASVGAIILIIAADRAVYRFRVACAWRHIADLGGWRYQINSITYERRAVALIRNCKAPKVDHWLKGGDWYARPMPTRKAVWPEQRGSE